MSLFAGNKWPVSTYNHLTTYLLALVKETSGCRHVIGDPSQLDTIGVEMV